MVSITRGTRRLIQSIALGVALAGCQAAPQPPQYQACGDIPHFADNLCLLDSWVAFGLEAQRGNAEWRERMLAQSYRNRPDDKAVRAVALSWGEPAQWAQASELYKASLPEAPERLQPLLQQWLNELERRRDLRLHQTSRTARQESDSAEAQALKQENQQLKTQLTEMSDKLEALTDIERTMNSRH